MITSRRDLPAGVDRRAQALVQRAVLTVDRAPVRRPGSAAAAGRPGPAAIRLSLLASARRLPACKRLDRDGQPGEADDTVDDDVGDLDDVGQVVDHRDRDGSAAATSAVLPRGHRRTTDGRNSFACSITAVDGSTDAERRPPRSASASARMTSRVCVPIDPDEPAMATLTGPVELGRSRVRAPASRSTRRAARTGRRRSGRARHRAADDGTEVLHVEVALEHALGEVAERGEHRDHDAEHQQVAGAVHVSLRPARPMTNSTRA